MLEIIGLADSYLLGSRKLALKLRVYCCLFAKLLYVLACTLKHRHLKQFGERILFIIIIIIYLTYTYAVILQIHEFCLL